MNIVTKWFFLVYCCFSFLGCAQSPDLLNQSRDPSLPDNIGIQGYSPVSYFEHNRAELGNSEYSVQYKKRLYYFTSASQVETFKKQPKKYIPRYGEYCPYNLALGRYVSIDPANFKIHNGKLLLFHNSVELSTVDLPSQTSMLEKADKEFILLNF